MSPYHVSQDDIANKSDFYLLAVYRVADPSGGGDRVAGMSQLSNMLAAFEANRSRPSVNDRSIPGLTWNLGVGGSFNFFGSHSFFVGVVGGKGEQWGTYETWSSGAGPGVGFFAGGQLGWSDAQDINDLKGPFVDANAGAGYGLAGGADAYTGSSRNGPVHGGQVLFGGGGGAGPSVGGSWTAVQKWGGPDFGPPPPPAPSQITLLTARPIPRSLACKSVDSLARI